MTAVFLPGEEAIDLMGSEIWVQPFSQEEGFWLQKFIVQVT